MKTLIITAHPADYAFTHKIVKRVQEVLGKEGGGVEVMNLYSKQWKQDILEFQSFKDFPQNPLCRGKQTNIQKEIEKADQLIFVYPIWWWGMPAILKNFFDINFTPGFAYKYKGKLAQDKLLQGKTARVFATSDTPAFLNFFLKFIYKTPIKYGILQFCGVKLKSFTIFSDMKKKKNDKDRERMLGLVEKVVRG